MPADKPRKSPDNQDKDSRADRRGSAEEPYSIIGKEPEPEPKPEPKPEAKPAPKPPQQPKPPAQEKAPKPKKPASPPAKPQTPAPKKPAAPAPKPQAPKPKNPAPATEKTPSSTRPAAPPRPAEHGTRDPFLGKTIGGYTIRERLATGPRVLTFLADQPSMRRPVLLRLLRPEAAEDQAALKDFYRAARSAAKIEHGSVLAVYAISSSGTIHFCALEHAEGTTAQELLRAREKLPSDDAIRVAIHVAEGLATAHEAQAPGLAARLEDVYLTESGRVKLLPPTFVSEDAPVPSESYIQRAAGVLLYALLRAGPLADVEEALEPGKAGAREAAQLPPIKQVAIGTPRNIANVVGGLVGNEADAETFPNLAAALGALHALLEVKEKLGKRAHKTTARVRARQERRRRLRRLAILGAAGVLLAIAGVFVYANLAARTVRRRFRAIDEEARGIVNRAIEKQQQFIQDPSVAGAKDVVARYRRAAEIYRGFLAQYAGSTPAAQAAERLDQLEEFIPEFQAQAKERLRYAEAISELETLADEFDAAIEAKFQAGGAIDTERWTERYNALARRYRDTPIAARLINARLRGLLRESFELQVRLEAQAIHRRYENDLRPANEYGEGWSAWDEFRKTYADEPEVREAARLLAEVGIACVRRDGAEEFARRRRKAQALAATPQTVPDARRIYEQAIQDINLNFVRQQAQLELNHLRAALPPPDRHLSDLVPLRASVGWGGFAHWDRSIEGNPIRIAGETYERGVGVHALSELVYDLRPAYTRFVAYVGVDDEKTTGPTGTVVFEVYADGRRLYRSGIKRRGEAPSAVNVAIPRGARQLRLVVTDAGDGIGCDHADWAAAGFLLDH
jgi:hypothetical protein